MVPPTQGAIFGFPRKLEVNFVLNTKDTTDSKEKTTES